MADALVALHFQNDICHPDGRIPFAIDHAAPGAVRFLAASLAMLAAARSRGWTVAHVHIGFAPDYADLPRNCRLFNAVERLGAVRRGTWGAAPFAGFEPRDGEIAVTRSCNSGFRNTGLDALLRARGVARVHVMGLATQFSVEHTVRDAADLGYAVTLLADCCSSADAEAHRASLRTLAMLADVVESTAVVAATLDSR
jgi:nicotinamidase-related amidase